VIEEDDPEIQIAGFHAVASLPESTWHFGIGVLDEYE
jgi:hypothetical protein